MVHNQDAMDRIEEILETPPIDIEVEKVILKTKGATAIVHPGHWDVPITKQSGYVNPPDIVASEEKAREALNQIGKPLQYDDILDDLYTLANFLNQVSDRDFVKGSVYSEGLKSSAKRAAMAYKYLKANP